MILLTVLTSERPGGVSYLQQTLQALDDNGARRCEVKMLMEDGDGLFRIHPGAAWERGWRHMPSAMRLGHRLSVWRAFHTAVANDADWLIFCEDDLNIAPEAIRTIVTEYATDRFASDLKIRGSSFVTFFDRNLPEFLNHNMLPNVFGIHRRLCMNPQNHEDRFRGTLCFLIHRQVLDFLVSCDPLESPFPGYHSGDAVMAYHLSKSPWPYYDIRVPTLIDHVGDSSIVNPDRVPVRGHNFAGQRDDVWRDMQKPFFGDRK